MDSVLPLKFANIEIVRSYIHTSGDKKYYVIHGDIFDKITSRYTWLAKLGDIGYSILLRINNSYNRKRVKKGLPYHSIGKQIKNKVKASVSYISDFEMHLATMAKKKECHGVICGHIHHPEIKTFPQNNILYLNAGDWVESLSALVEDFAGNWSIYSYEQRLKSKL
jgi:UDP-2,3-diacylglucosamine pyrophosphatase LpxH